MNKYRFKKGDFIGEDCGNIYADEDFEISPKKNNDFFQVRQKLLIFDMSGSMILNIMSKETKEKHLYVMEYKRKHQKVYCNELKVEANNNTQMARIIIKTLKFDSNVRSIAIGIGNQLNGNQARTYGYTFRLVEEQ